MAIPPDLKFDVRVRERLLDAGLVSQSEVDKHLEALPDMQAQVLDVTASNRPCRRRAIATSSSFGPPALVRPSPRFIVTTISICPSASVT